MTNEATHTPPAALAVGAQVDRPVRPGDEAIAKAVHEAVSAIYLDDSSDYRSALWSVVRLLAPDLAEMLDTDAWMAWRTSDGRANARHNDRVKRAGTAPLEQRG